VNIPVVFHFLLYFLIFMLLQSKGFIVWTPLGKVDTVIAGRRTIAFYHYRQACSHRPQVVANFPNLTAHPGRLSG